MSEGVVVLNPEAQALLMGGGASILDACQGVLAELTGVSGVFAAHLEAGQGKWPALSEGWRKRKGSERKFEFRGAVKAAITQTGVRIPGAEALMKFGSSADMYAGGEALGDVRRRFTSKGIFVDVNIRRGSAEVTVGFVGRFVKSAAFKKFEKGLWKDGVRMGAKEREQAFARVQRLRGAGEKKHAVQGSRGYVMGGAKGGGKGKMILARGDDQLAYANVLQRGQFLGVRNEKTGALFNPSGVAAARKKGVKIGSAASVVWGKKAMPLLPAESGDAERLARAFEGGLKRWCERNGW